MSRKIGNINHKIAYLTNNKNGVPKLKTKEPLYLRNIHREKNQKQKEGATACHDEMMELLSCLKRNGGSNDKCSNVLSTLLKCENQHKKSLQDEESEAKKSGRNVSGNINQTVINKLLKKNPTIINKEAWVKQKNNLVKLPSAKIQPFPFEQGGRPFRKPL